MEFSQTSGVQWRSWDTHAKTESTGRWALNAEIAGYNYLGRNEHTNAGDCSIE